MMEDALYFRDLGDGNAIWVYSMVFNDRVVFGPTHSNWYDRGFCFPKDGSVIAAAAAWDGVGDPPGPWIKEVGTDRYGPGLP